MIVNRNFSLAMMLDVEANRMSRGYRSMEEFEREEIRTQYKVGWSLDELYQEANLDQRRDVDEDPLELAFE